MISIKAKHGRDALILCTLKKFTFSSWSASWAAKNALLLCSSSWFQFGLKVPTRKLCYL